MVQTDPRKLLVRVTQVLDRLDISYLITGGIAVLVWGRPRFTADIDIVVELQEGDVGKLAGALRKLSRTSYADEAMMFDAVLRQGEFNFIDGDTGVKVDFWVTKRDEFSLLKLKRKVPRKIGGKIVYFISPEDLILSKLIWYRMGESTRQLEDIESIFKISGKSLDIKYIKKWAKRLGVSRFLKPHTR